MNQTPFTARLLMLFTAVSSMAIVPIASAQSAGDTSATPPATQPVESLPPVDAVTPDDFVEQRIISAGLTLRTPPIWQLSPPTAKGMRLNLSVDKRGNNAHLFITPQKADSTLDTAIDELLASMTEASADFRLVSRTMMRIGSEPAARIEYEITHNRVRIRYCQYFVFKNERQHILTLASQISTYTRHLKPFEQMVASLKFE